MKPSESLANLIQGLVIIVVGILVIVFKTDLGFVLVVFGAWKILFSYLYSRIK